MPGDQEPGERDVLSRKQPGSQAARESAALSHENRPTAEANTAAQFRFRLLLVEDEPMVRETARMILESEGYEVLTAADGIEGLHALSKALPDLIISDLNMPRMTGLEFLAIVRQRFPHIATIAISGGYSTEEMPLGSAGGRFPAKRKLHHQRACPRGREASGCFSAPIGGKAQRHRSTVCAKR